MIPLIFQPGKGNYRKIFQHSSRTVKKETKQSRTFIESIKVLSSSLFSLVKIIDNEYFIVIVAGLDNHQQTKHINLSFFNRRQQTMKAESKSPLCFSMKSWIPQSWWKIPEFSSKFICSNKCWPQIFHYKEYRRVHV